MDAKQAVYELWAELLEKIDENKLESNLGSAAICKHERHVYHRHDTDH